MSYLSTLPLRSVFVYFESLVPTLLLLKNDPRHSNITRWTLRNSLYFNWWWFFLLQLFTFNMIGIRTTSTKRNNCQLWLSMTKMFTHLTWLPTLDYCDIYILRQAWQNRYSKEEDYFVVLSEILESFDMMNFIF